MIKFERALSSWGSKDFKQTLQAEIEALSCIELPLQAGLRLSSVALDDNIKSTVLAVNEADNSIHARLGIFYQGIIAGCSCSDDPTPTDLQTEYCVIEINISKHDAEVKIQLAED